MADQILTQERLKEVLHYCPETGVFTWLVATGRRVRVGSVAGWVSGNGYLMIMIDGKPYLSHRLAWLYVHGTFPPDQLDHVNRVRGDNRICNLRLATAAENHQNQSMPRSNTSGHQGVSWHKRDGKWRANIRVNQKQIHLGYFKAIEEAISAYASAKARFHTFNPRLSHAKPKTRPISVG